MVLPKTPFKGVSYVFLKTSAPHKQLIQQKTLQKPRLFPYIVLYCILNSSSPIKWDKYKPSSLYTCLLLLIQPFHPYNYMGLHNLTSKKHQRQHHRFWSVPPGLPGRSPSKVVAFQRPNGSGGSGGSSPRDGSHGISSTIAYLVGGWTNPFEKYARQIGLIFPR